MYSIETLFSRDNVPVIIDEVVPHDHIQKYSSFIASVSQLDFEQDIDTEDELLSMFPDDSIVRYYTIDDYKLIYIKCDNEDVEYIILQKDDTILVVGMEDRHPFIVTNDFVYHNTDGSGYFEPKIRDLVPGDLLCTLTYTFVMYACNIPH